MTSPVGTPRTLCLQAPQQRHTRISAWQPARANLTKRLGAVRLDEVVRSAMASCWPMRMQTWPPPAGTLSLPPRWPARALLAPTPPPPLRLP